MSFCDILQFAKEVGAFISFEGEGSRIRIFGRLPRGISLNKSEELTERDLALLQAYGPNPLQEMWCFTNQLIKSQKDTIQVTSCQEE